MNVALSYQSTAGVILAGGRSERFGTPKQLFKLKNMPMVEWVLDNALKSRLQRIILVLGCQYQSILNLLGKQERGIKAPFFSDASFIGHRFSPESASKWDLFGPRAQP